MVVPVLIPLHQIDIELTGTGKSLFQNSASLNEMWSIRKSPDKGKINRRFRLYLDGLDEVPDPRKQRLLSKLANDLKTEEPLTQLVFTGREHVAGGHLDRLSRLHVAEMNDLQVSELIRQWFVGEEERADQFRKQIELIPSMKWVMRVPLLATLVLSVYESTSTLPESKIKLYDMFIALMAGGWDTAKRVHRDTEFGSQPKTTVLQYRAGRLQTLLTEVQRFYPGAQGRMDFPDWPKGAVSAL